MPNQSFSVRRFKNRNGIFSWRVDGQLNGVRIRRNFKTQEEAAAEKAGLEIKALQLASNLCAITTCLTEDQVREAESVFRRIAELGRSLSSCVDLALAHDREPTCGKPLTEAVADYIAFKEHELEQDLISEPYLVRLRREMNRLPKRCPAHSASDLTPARLVAYFEFGRASRKTYNNRRGIISGFLKFALQRKWVAENPLTRIPAHRIRRRRGGAQSNSDAFHRLRILGRVAQENGTIGRCWLAVRHESGSRKQVPCQLAAYEAKAEEPQTTPIRAGASSGAPEGNQSGTGNLHDALFNDFCDHDFRANR